MSSELIGRVGAVLNSIIVSRVRIVFPSLPGSVVDLPVPQLSTLPSIPLVIRVISPGQVVTLIFELMIIVRILSSLPVLSIRIPEVVLIIPKRWHISSVVVFILISLTLVIIVVFGLTFSQPVFILPVFERETTVVDEVLRRRVHYVALN